MKIIAKCTSIKWDFDGVEGKHPKLPKTAIVKLDADEYLPVDGEGPAESIADILTDKYGFCAKDFKVSYEPEITHAAAMKFLKAEAAKILEKAIAFRAKPECDACAWLKWLNKNINAKGYVLNFNSMTGEPISISIQRLA